MDGKTQIWKSSVVDFLKMIVGSGFRLMGSGLKYLASPSGGSAESNRGMLAIIEQCGIYAT